MLINKKEHQVEAICMVVGKYIVTERGNGGLKHTNRFRGKEVNFMVGALVKRNLTC